MIAAELREPGKMAFDSPARLRECSLAPATARHRIIGNPASELRQSRRSA
jgi:hypothetical protein